MTDLSQPRAEQDSRVVLELSQIALDHEPLNPTLQRIANIAVEAVPGVDQTSVTLMNGAKVRTVVFTGPLAIDLDERQYAAGNGPCMDAAVGTASVLVDASDPGTPYGEFAAACRRRRVTHVMSIGLPLQQQTFGALNLYSKQPDPPESSTVELAETVAAYAAVAVGNAAQYDDAVQLAEQLRRAMLSRAVIEQAKGILMARHHYSSEAAFLELTRLSQRSNRKLREVAGALVAGVTNGNRIA